MSEPTTEEALTRGLVGIDASRRVGWAKAFENERRVADLETQISSLNSEQRSLRFHYCRLVAFLIGLELPDVGDTMREIERHRQATASFMEADAWRAGMEAAGRGSEFPPPRPGPPRDWKQTLLQPFRLELARKALDLGHSSATLSQTLDRWTWRWACSCGEEQENLSEKDARRMVWEHRAQVVHGVDYRTWRNSIRDAARPSGPADTDHQKEASA